MVQGELLSAVAKRRRLIGDTASPSPLPAPLSEPSKIPPVDQHKIFDETNTFSALIDSNSDHRPLVKEIGTVSSRVVGVRLSEGARCHVSGIYKIWVKKGAVSINCAVINTNSPKQTVYASRAYSVPSIIGKSAEVAEFEIIDIDERLPGFLGRKSHCWATPNAPALYRSFIILGLPSPSPDDFRPSELNDLHTCGVRRILRAFAKTAHAGTAPTVALTGTRIQGISAQISIIVNQLLSALGSGQRPAYPRGVLFVDCDPIVPEFGPPGTISLVAVTTPLLGPPFTHPGVQIQLTQSSATYHILNQEWIGTSTSAAALKHAYTRLLHHAVDRVQESKIMPLLIKGWEYFNSLTDDSIIEVAMKLKPSHVFSFCSYRAPNNDRAGRLLAAAANVVLEEIHVPTGLEPSLVEQHQLSLQSHFHVFQGTSHDRKQWVDLGFADIPSDETLRLFYYGEKPNQTECMGKITAIWPGFDHDYFAADDLNQKLTGSLVALVLEPQRDCQAKHSDEAKATEKKPSVNSSSTEIDSTEYIEAVRDANTRLPMVRGGVNCSHAKRCLSLGIIKAINCTAESITLWCPVSMHVLQECRNMDLSFHLHLIKRDVEGRNDTSWAFRS